MTDTNTVHLTGTLATDVQTTELGLEKVARLLVTTKTSEPRRRVDVIPVAYWNPDPETSAARCGDRVDITGSVQRRFFEGADGRRSRIEIIADYVQISEAEPVG